MDSAKMMGYKLSGTFAPRHATPPVFTKKTVTPDQLKSIIKISISPEIFGISKQYPVAESWAFFDYPRNPGIH